MPKEFPCPSCGKRLLFNQDVAGQKSRCPECGEIFRFPSQAVVPEPPPPKPESTKAPKQTPRAVDRGSPKSTIAVDPGMVAKGSFASGGTTRIGISLVCGILIGIVGTLAVRSFIDARRENAGKNDARKNNDEEHIREIKRLASRLDLDAEGFCGLVALADGRADEIASAIDWLNKEVREGVQGFEAGRKLRELGLDAHKMPPGWPAMSELHRRWMQLNGVDQRLLLDRVCGSNGVVLGEVFQHFESPERLQEAAKAAGKSIMEKMQSRAD